MIELHDKENEAVNVGDRATDDRLGAKLQAQRKQALRGAKRKLDSINVPVPGRRRVPVQQRTPTTRTHASGSKRASQRPTSSPAVHGDAHGWHDVDEQLARLAQPVGQAAASPTTMHTIITQQLDMVQSAMSALQQAIVSHHGKAAPGSVLVQVLSTHASPALVQLHTLNEMYPRVERDRRQQHQFMAWRQLFVRMQLAHLLLPAGGHAAAWIQQLQQQAVALMERLNLLHVGDAHGKGVRPLFERFVRQPYGSTHPFTKVLYNVFDITADMQESAQENYNQLAKIIGLVQRIDRAADQPMGGAPEGTATSGEPLAAGDAGNSKHTTGKTREAEPTCSGTNSINEPTTQHTSSTAVTQQPRKKGARHAHAHKAMHKLKEAKMLLQVGPSHRLVQLTKPGGGPAAGRPSKKPKHPPPQPPAPGQETPTSKRAALAVQQRPPAATQGVGTSPAWQHKVEATPQQQLQRDKTKGTPYSEEAIPATGGKSTANRPIIPGGLPALLTVMSPQASPGVDSHALLVQSARKSADAKPKPGAGWMQNAARKSSRQLFGMTVNAHHTTAMAPPPQPSTALPPSTLTPVAEDAAHPSPQPTPPPVDPEALSPAHSPAHSPRPPCAAVAAVPHPCVIHNAPPVGHASAVAQHTSLQVDSLRLADVVQDSSCTNHAHTTCTITTTAAADQAQEDGGGDYAAAGDTVEPNGGEEKQPSEQNNSLMPTRRRGRQAAAPTTTTTKTTRGRNTAKGEKAAVKSTKPAPRRGRAKRAGGAHGQRPTETADDHAGVGESTGQDTITAPTRTTTTTTAAAAAHAATTATSPPMSPASIPMTMMTLNTTEDTCGVGGVGGAQARRSQRTTRGTAPSRYGREGQREGQRGAKEQGGDVQPTAKPTRGERALRRNAAVMNAEAADKPVGQQTIRGGGGGGGSGGWAAGKRRGRGRKATALELVQEGGQEEGDAMSLAADVCPTTAGVVPTHLVVNADDVAGGVPNMDMHAVAHVPVQSSCHPVPPAARGPPAAAHIPTTADPPAADGAADIHHTHHTAYIHEAAHAPLCEPVGTSQVFVTQPDTETNPPGNTTEPSARPSLGVLMNGSPPDVDADSPLLLGGAPEVAPGGVLEAPTPAPGGLHRGAPSGGSCLPSILCAPPTSTKNRRISEQFHIEGVFDPILSEFLAPSQHI